MVLRNVQPTLADDYQMPYWVSYMAFAVATILLGGVLGLILVCYIDCVYPPRTDDELHHYVQQATRPDKKVSDVEEGDDVEELESSQDEGEDQDTQDEELSLDEGNASQEVDNSQAEGSQNENQGEESLRAENKIRRRRARKAD